MTLFTVVGRFAMLGLRVVNLAIVFSILLILFPNVPVPVMASPTSNNLNGLVMVSGGIGWAVGDAGTILHYDGSAWSQISIRSLSESVRCLVRSSERLDC